MIKPEGIPAPAIRRLSLYLRQLEAFHDSNLRTISSKQLGQALCIADTQVRKDLTYFGQFGRPGIGYGVSQLITKLRRILGTDQVWNVILVGAGNLGRALLTYRGFQKRGFEWAAVFDNDPDKIGKPIPPDGHLVVHHIDRLPDMVPELNTRLAVLAVPAPIAQSVAEAVITAGVEGILNFAPVSLHVPPKVSVSNIELAVQLEQLSFSVGTGSASDA
jgi:redox-sensing transcriptional repressor